MKKILILSLAYFPRVGGAEVAIKEITNRINPSEFEFHMITHRFDARSPREEKLGNVVVHRIGSGEGLFAKFLFQFFAARTALALHRREHFGALWVMMAHSAGVPAALFNLRRSEVPYLLTLQEGDPPPQIERTMLPLWPLFARAFTHASAVQPISHFLADWARCRGGKNVKVIPNGVDAERFAAKVEPEVVHLLRASMLPSGGGTLLVTVSRLVTKNGIDSVIRALPHMPESVKFVIIGAGPEQRPLEALAQECAVTHRVDFIGHQDSPALPLYLQACDIFIRPSRSEGMGNAFIEAMAAGLPVIATQEGGIADFLFDAKRNPGKPATGFAVDKDSPAQIAEAVKYILNNPDEVARTVANAKRLVTERYDWSLIARQMEALFARLTSR